MAARVVRSLLAVAALTPVGCAARDPYVDSVAACPRAPMFLGSRVELAIDTQCYEALTSGIEHWGVGTPHAFNEVSTLDEVLVAGLYVVLGSDTGTAAALRDEVSPAIQGPLRDAIDALIDDGHLDDEDPASRVWFGLISREVKSIVIDDSVAQAGSEAGFSDGKVGVSPALVDVSNPDSLYPGPVASLLVHEAAHGVTPPHDMRNGDGFDPLPDGSYGVQATWIADWWGQAERGTDACENMRILMWRVCGRIEDIDRFPDCDAPRMPSCRK